MKKRRRFKQTETLQARLAKFAAVSLEQAKNLPAGPEREALLKKARSADTAAHFDQWAASSGLQPTS